MCVPCVLKFKPQISEILKTTQSVRFHLLKKIQYFGKNCGFTLWVCTNVVGRISGLKGKNQGFRSGYMYVKKLTFKKQLISRLNIIIKY
jgi:hypothetical protein